LGEQEVTAAGLHRSVAQGLSFLNVSRVLAHPELAREHGLWPMNSETWARKQRGLP
jgi:hypothetical protein